jgi:serine/threonine-protein kinase
LISVLTRQLPPVRETCPEIPVALDRIVARAVERDPRARYASAGELQHDLLHARTALRRQRAAQTKARLASQLGQLSEWDLPTRQHAAGTAFRRPTPA